MCDVAEICDGVTTKCPPDINLVCPWAWIASSPPPTSIQFGKYCGYLNDNSTAVITTITTDLLMNVMVRSIASVKGSDWNPSGLSAYFFSLSGLTIQQSAFSYTSDFQYSGAVWQLVNVTKTSLVLYFPWTRAPSINAAQFLSLVKGNSCMPFSLPAGLYSGGYAQDVTSFRSIRLQIDPRDDLSVDQTGTLLVATNFVHVMILLTFISYSGGASGDVFFTSPSPAAENYISRLLYNQSDSSFSMFFRGSKQIPLSSSSQTLPVGYFCAPANTFSPFSLCITVPSGNATSVQIDLTGAATPCRNVTATLTSPFWTVDPLPQCLNPPSPAQPTILNIRYDFVSRSFVLLIPGTIYGSAIVQKMSVGCSTASPLYCGYAANGWTYATPFSSFAVSAVGMYSATALAQQVSLAYVACSSANNSDYSSSSSLSLINLNVIGFRSNTAILTGTKGYADTFTMLSSNCFQPASTLTRFFGSVMFATTTTKVEKLVEHFASVLVNATPTNLDRYFSDVVVKISNATNLVCSLYGKGLLVAGGSIIFSATPVGTCDDVSGITFTGNMSQTGGIVTVGIVSGRTALANISIPTTVTSDPIPSGMYCADLGMGDFVMAQQNTDGSTTVYSSVGGSLEQVTLWTDFINQGTQVVVRGASRVTFANFTAQGYGVSIAGSQKQLTTQACNILSNISATGKFCGVADDNPVDSDPNSAAFISNTSFATLSLAWNQAMNQYSIELFASRRLSPSKPLSVTFTGHPWLMPFTFPGVRLLLSGNTTPWSLLFADQLGPMSVSLSSSMCGSSTRIISGGTVCGTPLLQGTIQDTLQVFVDVTSRSLVDSASLSLTIALLDVTSRARTSFINITTAVVIDGRVMYWAGASLPSVMAADVTSSSIKLVGPYGGTLSSQSCPQLLYPDQHYCGTNGSSPWKLVAGAASGGANSFWISVGSGSGFGRLSVYYLPPMNMAGAFSLTRTVGPLDVTALQYFTTNDTFVLTTGKSVSTTATTVILSRGKCNAKLVPDGEYCAYIDSTSVISFEMTMRNGTVFTRLPGQPQRLKCVGMQSAAGGLYDCNSAQISYTLLADFPPATYDEPAGQAFLSYSSASGGVLKASFSGNGGEIYFATRSSCGTSALLLRSFTGASTMTSPMFSNNTRVTVNSSGTVFVADVVRNCIFTVHPSTGFVQVFVGQCDTAGYADGAASDALFNATVGIVFDQSGILYVMDAGNARVRTITQDGNVSTMSGSGIASSVDGTGSTVSYLDLASVTLHPVSGRLYISEAYRIRILNQAANSVKTFVGSARPGYVSGTGTRASLNRPGKAAFTSDGLAMYFVDSGNNCLRKASATGLVLTVATGVPGNGGFLSGIPKSPQPALVDDATGNVLIIDSSILWIFVSASGGISTYAGPNALVTPDASDMFVETSSAGSLYISDGRRIHALSR